MNIIVDYVGRFENIDTDYKKICGYIDIEYKPIPHLNRAGNKDYKSLYNNNTRDHVANRCKEDIMMFHYEF